MSSKNGNKSMITDLNTSPTEYLKQNKFTDVTLICGASKLRAHKVVLTVGSTFFHNYFQNHKNADEVVLDADFVDLKCLLLYMYQGVLAFPIERKTSFLQLAKQLMVHINQNKIFDVRTRMEIVNGNEYNELSFEQDAAAGECAKTTEVIHVKFSGSDNDGQPNANVDEIDSNRTESNPKVVKLQQKDFVKTQVFRRQKKP